MKTNEIRSKYLEFFERRDHKIVASGSLIPANDPTLLFTNAGMNQFKDALTGRESLAYKRATTAQRCVRAGGKHNDLENVGYTARHHTFFEMLGNFSFGDYFKDETIRWAWEFVTDVLELDQEKIWVTVHPSDDEAALIWTDAIGIRPDRVVRHEENFWAMGDTGPCGPCSELFYDLGPDVAGGPPGSPDEDGDRYLEFWNLVFPQYDRAPDGELNPLDNPGVDTGMGLERIAAIVQHKTSNYEIDLFRDLITHAGRFAGINDENEMVANPSLRVIADHIRSAAFLVADGVIPSNEDRGYVLRRLIRRGLRHGYKLDIREPFFHRLVEPLVTAMADAYPIIGENSENVVKTLAREEERFAETLNQGMEVLERAVADLDGKTIPGDVAFQLYDTYGFPADLTADVARERGLDVDMEGFETRMEEQRQRGRAAASRFDAGADQRIRVDSNVDFLGYGQLDGETHVIGLFREGEPVDSLQSGVDGVVVLDQTPFYAESGGQVGDTGSLGNDTATFAVSDTQKAGGQHLHCGVVERGEIKVGDVLGASVDQDRRRAIALNHSATHLLHAALRAELGTHVEQRGSLVDAGRLRFDFSHDAEVSRDTLRAVERIVNGQIRDNSAVSADEVSFDEALERGAMALFGEKYGDEVRLLTMADGASVELCGGTHVARTGDIGVMRITSESGIAAGVRRIEAVTGANAEAWIEASDDTLDAIGHVVRAGRGELAEKVNGLNDQNRVLQKEIEALKAKLAAAAGADLADGAIEVNGVNVLATTVEGDAKSLLSTLDNLRDRLGSAVVVLGCIDDRVSLITGVTKDLTDRVDASELVRFVGAQVGAKGGGRGDTARAGGGTETDRLPDALASVEEYVRERVA